MASTAHKTDEEIRETRDAPADVEAKVEVLAELIRRSRRFVVWTGAGVSTSTGVPDFRGPNGKWTLEAQGRQRDPSIRVVSTLEAKPSLTHMSLVALLQNGMLKHLISTNTDGLHRRSGVDGVNVSELHGNSNKSRCDKCFRWAFRDDRVRLPGRTVHDHSTGQPCPFPKCTGSMHDTIINFGEYLHPEISATANAHGDVADVLLVLGSSLRVVTCDALEKIQANRGTLVVVNLQTTPYDSACALRIFSDCDTVMQLLLQKLRVSIPPWRFRRHIDVVATDAQTLEFRGVDETSSMPVTFAKCITLRTSDGGTVLGVGKPSPAAVYSPITIKVTSPIPPEGCHVEIAFPGHYHEPLCVFSMGPKGGRFTLTLDVEGTGTWSVSPSGSAASSS